MSVFIFFSWVHLCIMIQNILLNLIIMRMVLNGILNIYFIPRKILYHQVLLILKQYDVLLMVNDDLIISHVIFDI
jgi:hypothetical protein